MSITYGLILLFVGLTLGFVISALFSKTDGDEVSDDCIRLDWLEQQKMQVIVVGGGKGIAVVTHRNDEQEPKTVAVGYTLRETIDGAMTKNG